MACARATPFESAALAGWVHSAQFWPDFSIRVWGPASSVRARTLNTDGGEFPHRAVASLLRKSAARPGGVPALFSLKIE